MLKIKDSVNLEELEKFGFIHSPNEVIDYFINLTANIYTIKKDSNYLDVYINDRKIIGDFIDVLYDLIQAGLVEKVVDNENNNT